MSNQEILTKAIQKAIDGGWAPHKQPRAWDVDDVLGWYSLLSDARQSDADNWKKFIFNHEFAKALWGDKQLSSGANTRSNAACEHFRPAWQYHLQHMVTAEDPIKYLGEHLDD